MARRLDAAWDVVDAAAGRVASLAEVVATRSMSLAEAFARDVAAIVYALVVVFPRWVAGELPKLRAAVGAFLGNEVLPTSEFFVEVPLNLGGAAVRDLLVRLPYWVISEGPQGFVKAARWLGFEFLVLLGAMMSRLDSMASRVADAALWALSMLEGGLHWIVIDVIWAAGPFLLSLVSDAFVRLIAFVHGAVIFVLAARLWLWHAILGIPDFLAALLDTLVTAVSAVAEAIADLAQVVATALGEVFDALSVLARAIPPALAVLLQELPDLLRTGWSLLSQVLRLVLYDAPLAYINLLADAVAYVMLEVLPPLLRALVNLLADTLYYLVFEFLPWLARAAWKQFTNLLYVYFVQVPREILELVADSLRWLLLDLPVAIWKFVFVQVPQAIVLILTGAWQAVLDLWQATLDVVVPGMRWLANRFGTGVTWVLAIAISPLYLLWRIGGFTSHGPPRRHA